MYEIFLIFVYKQIIDCCMKQNIYGEPYAGDSKFVALCRRLQSIYRVEINQKIRGYVGKDRVYYFGNYIEDGEHSGANFLEDYIFEYAKFRVDNRRKYETIESDRLFNNLLSSQPMAFNLFCPLRKMVECCPDVATDVIRAALPMYRIAKVTDVDLEFIPSDYKKLTGDKSAMDAIIRFEDDRGKSCFIAIETKYSENLGTNEASTKDRAIDVIKELKCFNAEVEQRINCEDVKLTQIYRNFLLSEAYGRSVDAESYSLILAPSIHPSTEREVQSLCVELRDDFKRKVHSLTLESFVDGLLSKCPEEYMQTFEKFKDRYLNFVKASNI